jgi:type IV pilus assembly protein PilB
MISTPEAARASELFETFVRDSQIVLIQQLQAWREDNKDRKESFERQVIRNYTSISENIWIDRVTALHKKGSTPAYYPCIFPDGACPAALSPLGNDLAQMFHAIIIHDNPVLLVGLVNPFLSHEVYKQLSFTGQHADVVFVSITPHQYQQYVAMQFKKNPIPKIDWSRYSGPNWAEGCHLTGAAFPKAETLVEVLWKNDPVIQVVYPHMFPMAVSTGKTFHFCVRQTPTQAWVATSTPTEVFRDEMYQFYSGKEVFLLAIPPEEAARLIQAAEDSKKVEGINFDVDLNEPLVVRNWPMDKNNESSVWVQMLQRGIAIGASDIVLEPVEQNVRVRFRVDGSYIEQAPLRKDFFERMSTRIKTVAHMESGVKGISQTGRGDIMYKETRYDQRYSITVLEGQRECICVRIHNSYVPTLADLNLPANESEILHWFLGLDRGMLIVTGPTGSGKSTTLYACLNHLTKASKRILTIEDPVEKRMPALSQIGIHPKEGITFETAMRDAVRQAPDILMVGEIRDRESAITAFDAASTGHLLLTTLHTNDAPGTIERLTGPRFAVDVNTISLALRLIVNQALLPRLCPACRMTRAATHHDTLRFPDVNVNDPVISEMRGCSLCRGTGIQGRIVIMELMPVDVLMQGKISAGATAQDLRNFNEGRGFLGLNKQATRYMLEGEISVDTAARFLNTPIMRF